MCPTWCVPGYLWDRQLPHPSPQSTQVDTFPINIFIPVNQIIGREDLRQLDVHGNVRRKKGCNVMCGNYLHESVDYKLGNFSFLQRVCVYCCGKCSLLLILLLLINRAQLSKSELRKFMFSSNSKASVGFAPH